MKTSQTRLIIMLWILLYAANMGLQAQVTTTALDPGEYEKLKNMEGVYQKGVNYNPIINGHGTGLRPPSEEEWEEIKKRDLVVRTYKGGAAPASIDNSRFRWFPPVGNQDGEGSCVSWACGYYTKTFQEAYEHNWDLSDCEWVGGYDGHPEAAYQDRIFTPDFIYHQVNGGQDRGSTYSDNMDLLKDIGCSTWEKMPYDPQDHVTWPEEAAWREAPLYRSRDGYRFMWVDSDAGLENLKNLLADTNLAVISIDASLYNQLTQDDLWTTELYEDPSTNHANTIVGYDDNYGPYTENGQQRYGAFKVVNSWGTGSWENVTDGFYYISYETMKQIIQYIFFYENLRNYEPQMLAVFNMQHDYRGECEIGFGIGDPQSPDATKVMHGHYYYAGGDQPFPDNDMTLDITELQSHLDVGSDEIFQYVRDTATPATGTLQSYEVEIYDDYRAQNVDAVYTSPDPPLQTIPGEQVYARIVTEDPPSCSLTVKDSKALPGDQVSISVVADSGLSNVAMMELHLDYDLSLLTYQDMNSQYLSSSDVHATDGQINLVWIYSDQPMEIPAGDTLINLNYTVDQQANQGDQTTIDFVGENVIGDPDENEFLLDLNPGLFTVDQPNQQPVVEDIPGATTIRGEDFSTISLDDHVDDPNHPDEDLLWSVEGENKVEISIDEHRIVHTTVQDPDWTGSDTVTFTVTDPGGLSDQDQAVFTVEQRPGIYLNILDQQTEAASGMSVPVRVDSGLTNVAMMELHIGYDSSVLAFEDMTSQYFIAEDIYHSGDQVNLVWVYSDDPLEVPAGDTLMGLNFKVRDDVTDGQTTNVVFNAENNAGDPEENPFRLVLSDGTMTIHIDEPPFVDNSLEDLTVEEDASPTQIGLGDVFSDPDDPDGEIVPTVSSNGNPELVTANIEGGVLTLSYEPDQHGSSEIIVRGTSNGSWVEDAFTVVVEPVDDPPYVADSIPNQTVDENAPDTEIELQGVFKDPDNPDEEIEHRVEQNSNTDLVEVSIDSDRTLILSYKANQHGQAKIVILGSSNGNDVKDTFKVQVKELTAINIVDEKNILVFPNPVQSTLTISGKLSGMTIEFLNLEGKVLMKDQPVNTVRKQYFLDSWPGGIYMVKFQYKGHHQVIRLMKE